MGMPYDPSIDPEDLFWERIRDRPSDPIPRLLYADWCDENDRPVMSVVQRWLAATRRWPIPDDEGWEWWGCEDCGLEVADSGLLPLPLFNKLPFRWEGDRLGDPVVAVRYCGMKPAEEALAAAWALATEKKWFRAAWDPDFGAVRTLHHSWVVPYQAPPRRPPEPTRARLWMRGGLIAGGILMVIGMARSLSKQDIGADFPASIKRKLDLERISRGEEKYPPRVK
jgi:uncharacterized protein (TIGR02996 family)